MLQDMITLTPFSPYNHSVCPKGIQVFGDYRFAQGQFLLSEPITRDTTFNLTISGMGVLKANTFESFDQAVKWVASNSPMHFQCLRFRGPAGKGVSFGVRVRDQNLEFWPFKRGQVNSPRDCNILPMRRPQTVLAFDIECGDIQVAVTNMSTGQGPVSRVFHGYCSQQIQIYRVALGSQVCLKTPTPHSLCKTNHDILIPGTVLLLNVDGPVQDHHKGSYFRIWIIRKKNMELVPVQLGGQMSDGGKPYNSNSSEMISVEPKTQKTFIIVVRSNEIHIKDPCTRKSRDVIKEQFDLQGLPLWVEFYRIGFNIQKTSSSWDWQDENQNDIFDTPPPPPPRPSNMALKPSTHSPLQTMTMTTASEQVMNINTNSRSRNARHRNDSNISVNLHCSPPTDTFLPFSSPCNDNNNVDNNNIRQSPIPFNPTITPRTTTNNTTNNNNINNNNFSPMEEYRDFDPIASASCIELNGTGLDSNPCLAPTLLIEGEMIQSKEDPAVWGEFDTNHYSELLSCQSQSNQGDTSYLSVLSGLGESSDSQQARCPWPISSSVVTRPIPQSAPVPCPGTKHKGEKSNKSLQSSSPIKSITKKLTGFRVRRNSSKAEEIGPAEASGVTPREGSQFCNEGFSDSDLHSRHESSNKLFSTFRHENTKMTVLSASRSKSRGPSNNSSITTTNNSPRTQSTAFSPGSHQFPHSYNREPESGSCSSSGVDGVIDQFKTFRPGMNNIAPGIPQLGDNMLQLQSPSSLDGQGSYSDETDDVASLPLNPDHGNNNDNNSNNNGGDNNNLPLRRPLRVSSHSTANDSGVGVDNEGDKSDVTTDGDDDDTDDALSDTSNTRRKRLSSFNSSGSHHNTYPKRVA